MTRNITATPLTIALFVGGLMIVGPAQGDQSQFINANVEARGVTGHLANSVDQIVNESRDPVWISYEVVSVAPKDSTCCDQNYGEGARALCGVCSLEGRHSGVHVLSNEKKIVELEKADQATILLRADQKRVMRIRVASSNCQLDAGGLRVVWLTGVRPDESVELLTRFAVSKAAGRDSQDDLRNQALMAIAQHADPSADRAYAGFVSPDQPSELRERAAFWLGASRGKSGLVLLEKMANTDPSPDVREKVAFAFFVSQEPQAVENLIRIAKEDSDARVRGQALFWLAQKAGQKASSAITAAIQNDPDTEVKKKAVFALTQMPKDEGVPKLIEVAQSNKNPEVRKQAMFWLGQSHDPRAVAFFEKILSQ
jgi:hypothetical protein